jgi:hypothetical protein
VVRGVDVKLPERVQHYVHQTKGRSFYELRCAINRSRRFLFPPKLVPKPAGDFLLFPPLQHTYEDDLDWLFLDAIGPRASYEPGRGMDDIDDLLAGLL